MQTFSKKEEQSKSHGTHEQGCRNGSGERSRAVFPTLAESGGARGCRAAYRSGAVGSPASNVKNLKMASFV